MSKQEYTATFKARIALELLKEEKSVAQISADYSVPPSTLRVWRAQALAGLSAIFSQREAKAEHTQQMEELAAEISCLIVQLKWLRMHLPLDLEGSSNSRSPYEVRADPDI